MADDTTDQDFGTDLDAVLDEATGAFLDSWSVAEELQGEASDATESIRIGAAPPRSVDDVIRTDLFDIEEVLETASSVIIELLDVDFADPPSGELKDETLSELQGALSPDLRPASGNGKRSAPIPRQDTQEIEILDVDLDDPFGATGIEFIDVDTGERVGFDVPYLETGLHEIEDEPVSPDSIVRKLGIRLKSVDERLELPAPWARFLPELRDEILAEPDLARRAAYLFLFGQVVRALGSPDAMTDSLQELAPVAGAVTRSGLLDRLATRWRKPDDEFFAVLRRLERLDDSDEGSVASVRRSAIAMERLLEGGLEKDVRARIRELVVPPETFPGLVVHAVDSHAVGDRAAALASWERLGRYAKGEMASASIALVAWLLQGTPGFFETVNHLLDDGWNSRALLIMMHREAVRSGDRLQEARALKRLVGLDVHLGKRLTDEGASRSRLKQETASRLVRLSTLLSGLTEHDVAETEIATMSEYTVLRDAISLNARSLHYLRKLERVAQQQGDTAMAEKALISQAAIVEEPNIRAVVWERVADLVRRNGGPRQTVRDYLERSLEAAPDCLPALISMGQHIIASGDLESMLALRGSAPDVEEVNGAWRRAELLERTGGDPLEILRLYRDARNASPSSDAHAFFCVERALARTGDWRGLRTLYDAASNASTPLGQQFAASSLDLEKYRLAVEVFLEDAYGNLSDAMLRYIDHVPVGDVTAETGVDQNVMWRVIAQEVDSDPGRAKGRLEVLLQLSRGETTPWRTRALTWYAHELERAGGNEERLLATFREVFERSGGVFLQRWAVRGLLRTGDAAWVAENLARGSGSSWVRQDADSETFRKRLAAELMCLSSNADRGVDFLEQLGGSDDIASAEVAERATVQAIRSRQWVRAIPWMVRCYPPEHRPALAEIARHLGASFDHAKEALEYIDASNTKTPGDPYVILCELELAYRARDWSRALRLISSGLGTIAAGSIDFRAFLLEQAVLVAEWGQRSDEKSVSFLEDLWSLGPTVGSSPTFAVAAFLRTFTRLKRAENFNEYATFVRSNFTPSVAEALLAEPRLYETSKSGAQAADWYEARVEQVPGPLQPYYRWMAATLRWMFGERDRKSVQDLADAAASGDPTHRVGPFLLAIAYRHADMYASCERQLSVLRTPGHSRPVQDWVLVRQLFHVAVTQNQTAEALAMLREEDAFQQFGWYTIAQELFARATRDRSSIPALRERAKVSAGAAALELEIAELGGDRARIAALAAEGLPEAVAQVEMQAASGELPAIEAVPQWDVVARWAEVRESIAEDGPSDVRRLLMDYLLDVDEELLGSPWCPLRLVKDDLSRFGFEIEELDRLRERFADFEDPEMGAEARLAVAREFLRVGRRDEARTLVPTELGPQLVYVAWSLFNFALDPFHRDEQSMRWALHFWDRRQRACGKELAAEVQYEVGRLLDASGDVPAAIKAYRASLAASPAFLPSQVAAGRLLISSENWRELALLWEAEMRQTEDAEALAGVAFRLGFLWERKLQDLPDADAYAEEAYRRVLRVRPNHFPSLYALLSISYRNRNWNAAEQYLRLIAEHCPNEEVRASYLCELGAVREYHLEDQEGAREAYEAAFTLDPDEVDALFGFLRADAACERGAYDIATTAEHSRTTAGALSVDIIRRRLEYGVTQRELRDLSHQLFGLSARYRAASDLLADVFPTHYAWLTSRLVVGAERGKFAAEAAEALRVHHTDQSTRVLCETFERVMTKHSDDPPEDVSDPARIGVHPLAEGRLVAAMHWAWRNRDLEAQGVLGAARARRASSELLRGAELTWVAATLMLRREPEEALDIAEQLLEQMPDFLPAVKVAKYAADAARDWEAVVRWYERDASMTRVSEVASADRLRASEVQREHLGDFDAALEQLRTVLAAEPAHAEAFSKLRNILLTKRDYRSLLEAYERRVEATEIAGERAELLNQMADVALNHLKDRRGAIGYLSRSLELEAKQVKRLRVLSELYEQEERWDKAVVCHRASAELVDDPIFLARLWNHIGHLHEHRLSDLKKARNAYARSLKLDPDATEVLLRLARVCERLNEFADAAALLAKVVTISRDPKVLLDARIGIARLKTKMSAPPSDIVGAIRDVLLHHPGHVPSIDAAKQALARAGMPTELESFFGKLTHDTILMHGERALGPAFEMALHLNQPDRAFCIASISERLQCANRRMLDYHRDRTIQRRWPARPLPPDLTSAVLPPGLVAPFMELLRLSREGVMEGFEGTPGAELIKKNARLKDPKNKATQLAFQWPGLMGLELRDVYLAEQVPLGSVVVFDGGVRMVLDERWTQVKDPTDYMVALGVRLASWSMGVGPWSFLDLDSQVSLFIAIVSNYVRGWAHAERAHLPASLSYPRIQRWLERKGQRVAPYAMEISGRFSTIAVRQQFELLLAAQKRIACVLIDDPGRALQAAGLLTRPEPGDRPPWLFMLDAPAANIRRAVGVAV